MEKILFGLFFTTKELNVIDQQHVNTAVFIAEVVGRFLPEGVHKLVGKLLGTDIERINVFGYRGVTDGM